jgi:hypothetical protein
MYGIVKLSQSGTMVSDPTQSKVIVGGNEVLVLLNDRMTACIKSGVLTLVKEVTDEEFNELTAPKEEAVADILDVDSVENEVLVEEVVAEKPVSGKKKGSNTPS